MNDPVKVFCSHNGMDKPRVKEIAARLAEAGIDPWVDEWEIRAGDDVVARINDGLARCDVGLVFFSKRSLESKWVQAEVSSLTYQAIEDGKQVIPVLLDDDAPIPELLRPRARVAGDDLQRLIDAIYHRAGKPPVALSRPGVDVQVLHITVEAPDPGRLRVSATLDGHPVAAAQDVALGPDFQFSYRDFLDAERLAARKLDLQHRAANHDQALHKLGQAIGKVVFAGPIGERLTALLDEPGAERGLHLVFASAEARLLALPFEAARLPDGRAPVLEPGVRVSRRYESGTPPEAVGAPVPGPLRILVAVGAPDEGKGGGPVLDLEQELQTILDAVDSVRRYGDVEVRILEVGNADQIREALLERGYHVIHISGHGSAGVITMENEDGEPVPMTPRDLVGAISASGRRAPLIFLAACHTGVAAEDTTGFAQGLLEGGVTRVLAMQTGVSDWYATRLAGAFYEVLGRLEVPLAGHALMLARQEVEGERRKALARGERFPGIQAEYATPALFLRGDEPPLLDWSLDKEAPAPPVEPPVVAGMPLLKLGDLVDRREPMREAMRVLTDHETSVRARGVKAGVALLGMGGVGKSALAGRLMKRLMDRGWHAVAVVGHWTPGTLAETVGVQLAESRDETLKDLGRTLSDPETPEAVRLQTLATLLARHKVLLVLDNFEDNLEVGGARFLDTVTPGILERLLEACHNGKVLVTSRHPVPGLEAWFAPISVGPLSPAQTRKLFYRLPGIFDQAPEALELVLRTIGGHPRMLEYLDALLRGGLAEGVARFSAVARRLRAQAEDLGMDLDRPGGDLDASLQDTLRLGARDILLNELLEIVDRHAGDLETLYQASVFARPVSLEALAYALNGAREADPEMVARVRCAVRRLTNISLLSALEGGLWVHRWTAESLKKRWEETARREYHRRAGETLAWRALNITHSVLDIMWAVRHFLEARAFDQAATEAWGVVYFLRTYGPMADLAAFCAEVRAGLPVEHEYYPRFCGAEGDALFPLGDIQGVRNRYQEARSLYEARVEAEPKRLDLQRELAVVYQRVGELLRVQGQREEAQELFEKALAILQVIFQCLPQDEPKRADCERGISVLYNKLGALLLDMGQREAAKERFEKSEAIAERLAQEKPERPTSQQDLSACYNLLGRLYSSMGQWQQAEDYYEKSLDIVEHVRRDAYEPPDFQLNRCISYEHMGDLAAAAGKAGKGFQLFREALRIRERLFQDEPEREDYRRGISISYIKLGDLLLAGGQWKAAKELFEKSLAIRERLARDCDDRADFQTDLVLSLVRMAQVDPTAAPRHLSRALDILRTLHGEGRLGPDKLQWLEVLEKMLGTR